MLPQGVAVRLEGVQKRYETREAWVTAIAHYRQVLLADYARTQGASE